MEEKRVGTAAGPLRIRTAVACPHGSHDKWVRVGRSPWTAADALVGFIWSRIKSRTRGSGADGGVRPTRINFAEFWDRRLVADALDLD
jgi:hypothetical protein